MNEVWSGPRPAASADEAAEAATIQGLDHALASLDLIEGGDGAHDLGEKPRRELYEVHSKRIDRGIAENWERREALVGRKLRE